MCFTILHRAAVDCNPLHAQCIAYGKYSVDSLYRTVIEVILPKKTQDLLSMHFLRKHHMTSPSGVFRRFTRYLVVGMLRAASGTIRASAAAPARFEKIAQQQDIRRSNQ